MRTRSLRSSALATLVGVLAARASGADHRATHPLTLEEAVSRALSHNYCSTSVVSS